MCTNKKTTAFVKMPKVSPSICSFRWWQHLKHIEGCLSGMEIFIHTLINLLSVSVLCFHCCINWNCSSGNKKAMNLQTPLHEILWSKRPVILFTGSGTIQTTNRFINMFVGSLDMGSVMHKKSEMKCRISRCLLRNEIDKRTSSFW